MGYRCQCLILAIVWIALAFLLVSYSLYRFGTIYTVWSLIISALIVYGGNKFYEWAHNAK